MHAEEQVIRLRKKIKNMPVNVDHDAGR